MNSEGPPPFREVEIGAAALRSNVERARALRDADAPFFVDVGADAWGHGIDICIPILAECNISGFVVGRESEAITVRALAPNLMVICTEHGEPEDRDRVRASDIMWAVRSREEAERQSAEGARALAIVPDDPRSPPALSPSDQGAVVDAANRYGISVFRLTPQSIAGPEVFGLSESVNATEPPVLGDPVMCLWAPVIGVKTVPPASGVSYGYTYRTGTTTQLALVSLGYGDGLDRAAGNVVSVLLHGVMFAIAGRVAMDAFVLDVGAELPVSVGERAVVWGDPRRGEPHVADAARALGTHSAELVTRLTARPRRLVAERDAS